MNDSLYQDAPNIKEINEFLHEKVNHVEIFNKIYPGLKQLPIKKQWIQDSNQPGMKIENNRIKCLRIVNTDKKRVFKFLDSSINLTLNLLDALVDLELVKFNFTPKQLNLPNLQYFKLDTRSPIQFSWNDYQMPLLETLILKSDSTIVIDESIKKFNHLKQIIFKNKEFGENIGIDFIPKSVHIEFGDKKEQSIQKRKNKLNEKRNTLNYELTSIIESTLTFGKIIFNQENKRCCIDSSSGKLDIQNIMKKNFQIIYSSGFSFNISIDTIFRYFFNEKANLFTSLHNKIDFFRNIQNKIGEFFTSDKFFKLYLDNKHKEFKYQLASYIKKEIESASNRFRAFIEIFNLDNINLNNSNKFWLDQSESYPLTLLFDSWDSVISYFFKILDISVKWSDAKYVSAEGLQPRIQNNSVNLFKYSKYHRGNQFFHIPIVTLTSIFAIHPDKDLMVVGCNKQDGFYGSSTWGISLIGKDRSTNQKFSIGIPPKFIVGTTTKNAKDHRKDLVNKWIQEFFKQFTQNSEPKLTWKMIYQVYKQSAIAVRNAAVFSDYFTANGIFLEEQ